MSQYQPGMAAPPGMEKMIRPEHVQKAQFLSAEKRNHYQAGILHLWNKALSLPESHGDRLATCQKLAEATQQLHRQHQAWKMQKASGQASNEDGQPAQTNVPPQQPQQPAAMSNQQAMQQAQIQQQSAAGQAARPASQDQQQGQPSQGQAAQNRATQLKEELKRLLLNGQQPVGMSPETQKWYEQHRSQATQTVQTAESLLNMISSIHKHVIAKSSKEPLTASDKQRVAEKMTETYAKLNRTSELMTRQRQALIQHQRPQGTSATGATIQHGQEQPAHGQAQTTIKNEAGEAAAAAAASQHLTSASPIQAQAQAQTPQSQTSLPASNRPAPAHVNLPVKSEPGRPLPHPIQGSAPYALSHQDAVDKARSYQHPPTQTPTSASASASASAQHAHPSVHSRADSQPRAQEKQGYPSSGSQMKVAQLQPVQMQAARPTLSGGPGQPSGVMGQPALQRHPGYVLEGEGERVLSEKKLEELVREVTGSGGGEGAETLDPEVKETLLDLADEFIDNVIMAACKVAKLRNGSTLDLRDIQLILERNYNIRVPGYASDELRTVKKIQPTQAWAMKMNAVQAAKVTGGKGDA